METVINSIRTALEKNGFPDKKVRLPFQPIFRSCKNHDTTLSVVLKELKSLDILHEMDEDRILFYHKSQSSPKKEQAAGPESSANNGIPDEIYAEAMEKLKSMDPKEVERMKEQVMNMSPKEQAEMMKQAQQMFKNKKK